VQSFKCGTLIDISKYYSCIKNYPRKKRRLGHTTPVLNLGTNNTKDYWLYDWWSVECRQQISTVKYVDDTKRRTPSTAADGDAETQRISDSAHDWCSVVNKLAWSKYVDNRKRRLRLYQLTDAL